jgi:hypothetical protein
VPVTAPVPAIVDPWAEALGAEDIGQPTNNKNNITGLRRNRSNMALSLMSFFCHHFMACVTLVPAIPKPV